MNALARVLRQTALSGRLAVARLAGARPQVIAAARFASSDASGPNVIETPDFSRLDSFFGNPDLKPDDHKTMMARLITMADDGDVAGQFLLGELHLYGWPPVARIEGMALSSQCDDHFLRYYALLSRILSSTPLAPDMDSAKHYHKMAANQGYIYSMHRFAMLSNSDKSSKLLAVAASKGNVYAQHDLATAYIDGLLGLEKDVEKGKKLLEAASKGGHVFATLRLAELELRELQGSSKDGRVDPEAMQRWQETIENQGQASEQRLAEADKWAQETIEPILKKRAETGEPAAQRLYGIHLLAKDDSEANKAGLELVKKAHEQGDTIATCEYGAASISGSSSAEDFKKGVELLQKAAQQGSSRACFLLGTLLFQNIPVAPKEAGPETVQLFRMAVEQSPPILDAAPWLYYMYKHGYGVEKDEKLAQHFERMAVTVLGGQLPDFEDNLSKEIKQRGQQGQGGSGVEDASFTDKA